MEVVLFPLSIVMDMHGWKEVRYGRQAGLR